MAWFFTADEHYGHRNISMYCGRPFASVEEMDAELVHRHNASVSNKDTVVHAGDTFWKDDCSVGKILSALKGKHIFLRGSHDRWLPKGAPTLWEMKIDNLYIVVCHYAMRTWPRSHYGSIQLFGHSHGKLVVPDGSKQLDVGVDCWDYAPVPLEEIKKKLGLL